MHSTQTIVCRRTTAAGTPCSKTIVLAEAAMAGKNCMNCRLRDLCLPVGLDGDEIESLDAAIYTRRRLSKGALAFRAGEPLEHLYAIRLGSFKSCLHTVDGREQVTGFQLPGELLGLDAIGSARHRSDAVALEDSELCVVPFAQLEELARRFPRIGMNFHRTMSREVAANQDIMLLLGRMNAEERLATFLLRLSRRWALLGYSSTDFVLRMSREDIGNYLGMKLETVSRMFSRLAERGLIEVRQREVHILDAEGLQGVIGAAVD